MSGFYRDVQLCPRALGQLVWRRDKNQGVSNPLSESPGKSIMKIRAAWRSYFDEGVGTAACFAPKMGRGHERRAAVPLKTAPLCPLWRTVVTLLTITAFYKVKNAL